MTPDERSADIAAWLTILDLWAIQEHITMLQREIPRIVDAERKRIRDEAAAGDEQEKHDAEVAEQMLDEGSTTRFLTGAALIALCATYESVVKRVAERLRQIRGLRLGLRDIRGESFLEQADKYFEDVLECKLHAHKATRERLAILYGLRNALAHANGNLDEMNDNLRGKIQSWAASTKGLSVLAGSLVVSIDFVVRASKLVGDAVTDLSQRTEAEIRRNKPAP